MQMFTRQRFSWVCEEMQRQRQIYTHGADAIEIPSEACAEHARFMRNTYAIYTRSMRYSFVLCGSHA